MKSVQKALARRAKGEKGFTLVELLVVVIIIGILAAVAVPIYLNQRKAAWKSSVESDVKNASLVLETAATQNNGTVNGLTVASNAISGTGVASQEITVSKNNKLTFYGTTTDGACDTSGSLGKFTTTGYCIKGYNTNDEDSTTVWYNSEKGGIE